MTTLEIILLLIGIVCFAVSFILTNDDSQPVGVKNNTYSPEVTQEQMDKLKQQVDEMISGQMVQLEESTEAALDKISNTKILEMNEYAEGVLNELNKNHNETVFMYDMLNEKSKEIKNVVRDINNAKAMIEQAQSTMQDNSESLEKLIKDSEKAVKEIDVAIKAAYKTKAAMEAVNVEDKQKASLNNVITPQFFEPKSEKIEIDVKKEPDLAYMAKVEPETIMASNCNEQILLMHSQGKSNLEIAKTLNLGMGEVKLVIDLYNKKG
jgi:DNA-binding NarL/FixJ family response regulator